jgi:predicted transcriptional regulator YdeE
LQASGVYPSSQSANGNPIETLWVGNAGSIKFIATPDGTVHWIVNTHRDLHDGHYDVVVVVNGKKYDEKPKYEKGSVQGRVNAKFAQRGAIISVFGSFIPPPGDPLGPATTGYNYFIAPGKY